MMLVTLADRWANFWAPFIEMARDSEVLQGIGGFIDTVTIPVVILVYFKYIAPRLAKANFVNKQFNQVVAIAERLDGKMEKVIGVNMNLKQDMLTLRDAFGIAFKNSKLGTHAKNYLTEVLAGIRDGRKVDPTEFLEDATEDTKQAVKEFVEMAENLASEKRMTALQQLEEQLRLQVIEEEESLDSENPVSQEV